MERQKLILTARERIIVAADVSTSDGLKGVVVELRDFVGLFRVGLEVMHALGTPDAVHHVHWNGGRVFADAKLHDIPNTVAGAARSLAALGVEMFNVHTLGGAEMMREAMRHRGQSVVLGVTILTSQDYDSLVKVGLLNDAHLADIGPDAEEFKKRLVQEKVIQLAQLAQAAGLNGVIASAQEAPAIRAACGPEFLIVTPGIRPSWAAAGDQKRITTPKQAIENGADMLVIGRPITNPPDGMTRVEAARRIGAEIEEALASVS